MVRLNSIHFLAALFVAFVARTSSAENPITKPQEADAIGIAAPSDLDLAVPDYTTAFESSKPANQKVAVDGASADIKRMPAAPSSAALFFSAVLSLGAWHALRSAKHFPQAAAPEWYHTGGPMQIGLAVAYDFHSFPVLNVVDVPAATPGFDVPAGHADGILVSSMVRLVETPRGPPAVS